MSLFARFTHARTRPPLRPRQRGPLHRPRQVAAVVLAAAAMAATTAPANASAPIILGAAGDAPGLSAAIGAPLARNMYGQLNGPVPTARWINMSSYLDWRTVAAAQPGSQAYSDIARWADTLKSRVGPILFTYSHEPEASGNVGKGTPDDFIRAYRHVVDIFRSRGVNNVEYSWQMTSYAFKVASWDRRAAANWYPGDSYVDNVASDPYNWYNCGPGQGRWVELSEIWGPTLAFARSHGKQAAIGEFASQVDPADGGHRAQWLRNANAFFLTNISDIRAVMYFQTSHRADCFFPLTNWSDTQAFAAMARDTAHYRGY